jgi:guanylate kinase
MTTRQPRPGEVPGRERAFVSPGEFDQLVAAGDLLEWASYGGHRCGTPRRQVVDRLSSGVPVLVDLDVAGALQVRAAVPESLLVYLEPAPADKLAAVAASRGSDADFDITLVNTSVEDAGAMLVALMTGQPAPQPAR